MRNRDGFVPIFLGRLEVRRFERAWASLGGFRRDLESSGVLEGFGGFAQFWRVWKRFRRFG